MFKHLKKAKLTCKAPKKQTTVFITRKRPSDVIDSLMTNWIGVFGIMGAILTDNGGEFNSEEMREVASILNVKVCTTAAESPFQNGLCERVHAITDSMLMKLEADHGKVNNQALLCWANMAKNSLQMWNGFSSHQLVFGVSPNLPNIMKDSLPALEGSTTSETFAKHINALHAARRAFIESESDERLRRALRSKVRASEQIFENGDNVFYKREGKDRWLGPGKVVFQDGKVVFVRHGGIFVRVSPNRLCKINNDSFNKEEGKMEEEKVRTIIEKEEHEGQNVKELREKPRISEMLGDQNLNQIDENEGQQDHTEQIKALRSNDRIQYKMPQSNDWIQATVISRAGKVTGQYKNWFNVKDDENDTKSVDLAVWHGKDLTIVTQLMKL